MVKKYTLTVPDELGDKIDQYKADFNLSEVFRAAIGAEIEKKENFKRRIAEDTDMEQVIARLRQEKENSENNYFDEGKSDALDWFKASSYEEIFYAAVKFKPKPEFRDTYVAYPIITDEIIGGYFTEAFNSDPLMKLSEDDPDAFLTQAANKWFAGWMKGVADFWKEVGPKIVA